MSTRSFIAQEVNSEMVEGIYCHWDGGLSWVGEILNEHYQDPKKVNALMKLGNISSLQQNLIPKTKHHSFDHPEKDVTVAYGRDRREKDQMSVFFSRNFSIQKACPYFDVEWFYLFKNNQWYVRFYDWEDWILLSLALRLKEEFS